MATMTRNGGEIMRGMRSITLRMPDAVAEWLDRLAKTERRSLNSQIVILLEAAQAAVERVEREEREREENGDR